MIQKSLHPSCKRKHEMQKVIPNTNAQSGIRTHTHRRRERLTAREPCRSSPNEATCSLWKKRPARSAGASLRTVTSTTRRIPELSFIKFSFTGQLFLAPPLCKQEAAFRVALQIAAIAHHKKSEQGIVGRRSFSWTLGVVMFSLCTGDGKML